MYSFILGMLQTLNTLIISILNKRYIWMGDNTPQNSHISIFCTGGPINLHEIMKYKNKPQLLGIERKYSSISRKKEYTEMMVRSNFGHMGSN